jgi:hypothetical protein
MPKPVLLTSKRAEDRMQCVWLKDCAVNSRQCGEVWVILKEMIIRLDSLLLDVARNSVVVKANCY